MKKRFVKLGLLMGALLLCGVLYIIWIHITGLMIPCVFRSITGQQCPGCGVSRMLLALLRFDFIDAWAANPVLLCLLPILLVLAAVFGVQYVRTGKVKPGKLPNAVMIVVIVVLVVFGVIRNLPL